MVGTMCYNTYTTCAGCAVSDDSVDRFLVKPDRYVLYNCTQLAKAARRRPVAVFGNWKC